MHILFAFFGLFSAFYITFFANFICIFLTALVMTVFVNDGKSFQILDSLEWIFSEYSNMHIQYVLLMGLSNPTEDH